MAYQKVRYMVLDEIFDKDSERFGFKDPEKYFYKSEKGLSKNIIEEISEMKGEPDWMRRFRLKAYEIFRKKHKPKWGPDLSKLNLNDIHYFVKPTEGMEKSWEDVPEDIRNTFDRLGIPEAEKKFLGGIGTQYESEMIYHNLKKELAKRGVIYLDMDTALKEKPSLVKKFIGTVVPITDNKFASLNAAAWSGGSFIYVPENVKVDLPLQAYFRLNAKNVGQFERTLIIAAPNSFVHYIEGCSAPIYSEDSLHAGVVEVIAMEGARVRYTTIQNWSNNVYNLVTKRAFASKNSIVEWIDGNIGSKVNMKYPAVYLLEQGAKAEILSISLAGEGQFQDAGAKVIHAAPNTSSTITSKSISRNGGRTVYRGFLKVMKDAKNSKSSTKCDALILDNKSGSDTIPVFDVQEKDISIGHEAMVGKINEEQLFYLMSRGLKESEALSMIVRGFIEPFVKQLPFEYAIELNRLIELEMEGSVG